MIKEDEYYAERKAEDDEERRKIERDFPEKEDVMNDLKGKPLPELKSKCNCGGNGEIRFQDYPLRPGAIGYDVQCLDCKWTTPTCDTPELAIRKWELHNDFQKSVKYGEYKALEKTIDGVPVSLTFEDTPLQNHVKAMAYRNGRDIIIDQMIAEELAQANSVWPQFASTHEGWAVITEEVNEALEDTHAMKCETEFMFEKIREHHAFDQFKDNIACDIKYRAVQAIKELLQVAAMCDKFRVLGKDMEKMEVRK